MFFQSENVIPNKIHLIWVGSPPSDEVLKNTRRWKKTNPRHQVHLWIDSGTYHDDMQIAECKKLQAWAKENDIIICDVNPNPGYHSDSSAFRNMSFVYEGMLNNEYYNDQINGMYKNLSFASDILRFEILYQLGGIYADVNDIYPASRLPTSMQAPFGFFCHLDVNDNLTEFNSDVIASIPRGTLIDACRHSIFQNLSDIYQQQPDVMLKAHRNPDFANTSLYSGSNPRYMFGIEKGGPGVVGGVVDRYMDGGQSIPEATSSMRRYNDFKFNTKYFNEPDTGQAGSWYGRTIEHYAQANAIFRSYVIDYFNRLIDKECEKMKSPVEASVTMFAEKKDNEQLIELLQTLRKRLNAFPPYLSMTELVNLAIREFNADDTHNIEQHTGLITRLSLASVNLEKMLDYIETEHKLLPQEIVDGLRLGNSISKLDSLRLFYSVGHKKHREMMMSGECNVTTRFIKEGIDNGYNEANYQALNTFIEGVEKIKEDHKKSPPYPPRLL